MPSNHPARTRTRTPLSARLLLWVLLLPLALGTTACKNVGAILAGTGAALGGLSGLGGLGSGFGGGFQGLGGQGLGGLSGGTSGLGLGGGSSLNGLAGGNLGGVFPGGGQGLGNPPRLGGPGIGGQTGSPGASLPVPPGSSQAAAQILQKYGVPVAGSHATPQALQKVAYALSHFARENLQGLGRINIKEDRGSLAGLWYVQGGPAQIDYYGANSSVFTMLHELAHHYSLFANRQAGQAFSQALGSGPQGHLSDYAYTNWKEKVAEACAAMLNPQMVQRRVHPQFSPTSQAWSILQQTIVSRR